MWLYRPLQTSQIIVIHEFFYFALISSLSRF